LIVDDGLTAEQRTLVDGAAARLLVASATHPIDRTAEEFAS
jgi:hypothetical protein